MSDSDRRNPRISVIVCTYEDPRALDLLLCGLARQSRMPDEIVIADDGSGPETAEVIESWKPRIGARLEHAWHVDNGFRKSRISNEAVRRSTGDLLIFLDGDSIPHRCFVEDHEVAARPDRISCGRRVKLGEELSKKVDRSWIENGKLESIVGPVLWSCIAQRSNRYFIGIRLPARLARVVRPRARRLMGVNFSIPRKAFEEINGYDEEPGIYARIDRDVEVRLLRAGYRRLPLIQRAIVYHLWHPERKKVRDEKTLRWLDELMASNRVRCEVGYDSPFDPNS